MAEIENHNNSHSDNEEFSDDEEEVRPGKKAESDSDAEVDGSEEEEEYAPKPKKATPKPKGRKRKGGEDNDSDDDWKKKKPAKKAATNGTKPKRATAFTKSFKLSEDLADVVGSDVMPRHEVVKKLWAVIKERELQDPKNKQFAICDDQLMKVFGIKRFRTFGMMKHLKDHFLEPVN